MEITTDFRRSPMTVCRRQGTLRRSWLMPLLFAAAWWGSLAPAQQASPATTVEPLSAIRAAAQSYVKAELAASPGESIVTAAELDSRLRLARCSTPLKATLPAGVSLQARATIAVA